MLLPTKMRCSSLRSHSSDVNESSSRHEGPQGPRPTRGAHPYEPVSYEYDTSKNRLFPIFKQSENIIFQQRRDFNLKRPPQKEGTEEDAQKVTETFGQLGFQVETYQDLAYDGIMNKLEKMCSTVDHTNTSCLAIGIFAHGEDGGKLYAADKKYLLSDVINNIMGDKRLAGKPKLFIIRVCRGGNVDKGHRIETDGGHVAYTIPTHADCLVMMSTVDDQCSGSRMIKALCEVLEETRGEGLHILEVVTLVNSRLASMTSRADPPELHESKQTDTMYYTLRKFLKL